MRIAAQERPTECAERLRRALMESLEPGRRVSLGQYFTPLPAARLIASMLGKRWPHAIRLLDPGAGVGSLIAAAVEHLTDCGVREIEIVACEIDDALYDPLRSTLKQCEAWAANRGLSVQWKLQALDYIKTTAAALSHDAEAAQGRFDAIVMNPPYRKVNGGSPERLALERVGLRISNLYTAFLALAATDLAPGGAIAAITPRSFANGPYAAPFRRFFFDRVGIEELHLFESRTHIFADANVLQENLIVMARQGAWPRRIRLKVSHGLSDRAATREVSIDDVVRRDDPHLVLRIPTGDRDIEVAASMARLPCSLDELDVAVSTGKVVEFRARDHLRIRPELGSVPLIRSNHMTNSEIRWPDVSGRKKPNALAVDADSERLLLPNGIYVLVKRLTAKEEPRRVRAAICSPAAAPGDHIAFENHLNVFHQNGAGLPEDLAHGLTAYLNSSLVDLYVRQFSGHTQINAHDLRHIRYPSQTSLGELGAFMSRTGTMAQEDLDTVVDQFLADSTTDVMREAA